MVKTNKREWSKPMPRIDVCGQRKKSILTCQMSKTKFFTEFKMSNGDQKGKEGDIFTSWMKSSIDFWTSMGKAWPDLVGMFQSGNTESQPLEFLKSWQSMMKMSEGLMSALYSSGTVASALSGLSGLPEIALKLSKTGWDGYFHLYQQWLEKSVGGTKPSQAYVFEKLDENTFKTWTEIYEKEFKQLLKMPKIGLSREYQERMAEFVDKFNVFQTTMAEFLYTLYLPIEKSVQIVQQTMGEMAKKGELGDDFKKYYKMWIKTLEGHYMTLFKSSEYTKILKKLLDAVEEYKIAREEVMMDMLQNLPLPTNRDIDDVYKELYDLKRQVRELSRKIEQE
ncbi:MAG: hypothetical protein DRG83_20420 [Deltaproteobacteria bacterium]|nr:MAG: hypothetical protein DRG83_20420 [Deltaproteobacteria bacterium]